MQITQYLHTAILVTHLEQAEYFYGTVLGLTKIDRILKYPGAWYQIGATQVHLIEDSTFLQSLQNSEKMGRNPHLALGVENLEIAQNHLMSHGCAVEMSASGRAALFTQDPDGNVIELTEIGS
ncbi:MAG: VOC family protein [Timaviella obliquedivisa GSE-PSE-MK23-08B]|jgi:catechol 2,3-dioxygenase-like lactoylglutathione lyase family enzyme|nr:VOC family protein [Timaviella obliquedivisa GSE-PSE-MK23-08B]